MNLTSPLAIVKGVGAQAIEKFARLGVETVSDLIYFFPRRYEDFSQVTAIRGVRPGKITLKATVESVSGRYVRRALHVTEAILDDGTAKTRAVWFNQPYRITQLKSKDQFYFSGTYELQRDRYVLSNPAAERAKEFTTNAARIVPIYPETAGLKSAKIRQVIRELLPITKVLPETMTSALIQREKLLGLSEALRQLHFPESSEQLAAARERLAFEELFSLQLAALLARQQHAELQSYPVPFDAPTATRFTRSLPFTMTNAQRRAAWDILQHLERSAPMNCLLQGDVGSGKTVVAALAAHMAAHAGYQTALMAPTEILATQHAQTLSGLLEPLGVRVGLLSGGLKKSARSELLTHTRAGEITVLVGTHALIQKDTHFARLGLVVIDEQHRFGVAQRTELLKKSERQPHLLTMTATPIPRSLQLTIYGELDITIIDELPAGRQPVHTRVCSPFERRQVYTAIDAQIASGHQAYVICPIIGDGAQAELKSAETEYTELKKSLFAHRRLGLLHGQLTSTEKDSVMRAFTAGEIDLLIATSVVEVGVDVPNATVMLIEGAERFGLAQLHQLRGRVGRGAAQSLCFLMPSSGHQASARLRELERSQDGFYLAEADLKLRGPGEIYGHVQHGQLSFRIADITDLKLLTRVRKAAQWLLTSPDDLLQYETLSKQAGRHARTTTLN